MNKKYLFVICSMIVISVSSLLLGLKHLEEKTVSEMLGANTFINTKNNLFKLGRIVITNSNQEQINLYYDGNWYFEEAADYFVDENAMRNLFNAVNDSVLVENAEPIKAEDTFNIKTFDNEGNLLDDINFANNDMSYVKYAGKKNWYKASNLGDISFNPTDLLPYPLLSVPEEFISAVNINNHYATKSALDEIKPFNENISSFFDALKSIDYIGIISEELFVEDYASAPSKEIKLYLMGGLNYRLQVYKADEVYYLKIMPERELIARTEVNAIIKTKKMYYNGWLFQLSDEQGKLLYEISLKY